MQEILEKFEFRNIRQEEADQAVVVEHICFPPHEACSEKHMKERIVKAPELFLVAIDKKTGKIAGFFNGLIAQCVPKAHKMTKEKKKESRRIGKQILKESDKSYK